MKICVTGDRVASLREAALRMAPELEVLTLGGDGALDGDPAGLEVLYFSLGVTKYPAATQRVLELFHAPGLRWVQSPGAGVDHPIWQTLLDRGVRLTNASGIHAEPIAQYIFTYVLFWEREVARHLEQQRRRHWEIVSCGDLVGRTLGIVGYGGIGRATARVAKAFGMRVVGCRRTRVDDPLLDRQVGPDGLHALLAESDYVVLCMPYSDETRGMIGRAELEAMQEHAVLVNVARGGVVDEPALVEALRAGRIRGATLDVVAEEPLPPDSPLWTLERCVITPHDAGYSPRGDERLGELFLDNLGRYVRGEPLRNEIASRGLSGDRGGPARRAAELPPGEAPGEA